MQAILPQLAELENLRGNPTLVYHSAITGDSASILYEYLRKRRGKVDRLDLVLSTRGGSVTVSRKIALLLRDYVRHLTIMVPHRARSAGTLLCLSANELVLGPMAELGPIDSQIGSSGPPPSDAPGTISAEDVRAFRQMAEEWFGVERGEDRLQTLALLAQRVFPTSLSSFYRFDKLVRYTAGELLGFQLPDEDPGRRQQIADKLVSGYLAHDYVLSRAEARELGLRVRYASSQEEALLWDLSKACDEQTQGYAPGMIIGTDFCARQVVRRGGASTQWQTGFDRKDTLEREVKDRPEWIRKLRKGGSRLKGTSQSRVEYCVNRKTDL